MSGSIRVLHVEDDGDFAQLTAECLEREDESLRVQTVTNVDQALELVGDVDCIVSDFDLPAADGISLLERVRQRDDRLPFILFTGKGSEEVASEALAAGATDYLQKERGTDQFTVLANRIENAVTRHRAVKELERQNERYRKAEEIADLGTWELDPGTGDAWLSNGGYRTLGLPRDYEPDPESALDHYHPEDQDAIVDAVTGAIEDGESYDLEARYRGGAGAPQWVRMRGDPTIEDDEVIRLRATIQDVTERKERETELERYETVVQAAGDPVYTLDADARFTFVNDALVEFVGYDAEELLGSHVSMCVDEPDISRAEDMISSLLADQRGRGTFEIEVITAAGERVPCEVHIALLPSDDEFRGTVGIVRDVSERERREQKLRRFGAIIEAVPVGVFFLDTNGVVIEINERAAAMAGVNRDEWIGVEFPALVQAGIVPQSVYGQYKDALRDLLSSETDTDVVTIETTISPQGRDDLRLIETYLTLLTSEGEWEGSVAIVRDVTDERAHEHALERKTERLTELIDIVSHDLRNPLNVAQSRLELAVRDGVESEHIDAATDALERVSGIIDDAVTLARLGEGVEEPTTVELGPLARRAWPSDATGSLLVEENVTVFGDPARLQTALRNLFENAHDYAGQDVTVRMGPIDDDGFYVADDGPGIPPDERDRIFEPGYTTDREGTGFGLAIVEHVAAAHGWKTAITDGEAGGARFEFAPAGPPA